MAAPLLLSTLIGCASDVCEATAVEVEIEFLDRALASSVSELFVELSADQKHWTRSFAIKDELSDRATSFVVLIEPRPTNEVAVTVVVIARDATRVELDRGSASLQASPDRCHAV